MPQIAEGGALEVAERLRAAIAAQRVRDGIEGDGLRVTASFGVVALDAELPVEEALDRADKAMYRAKSAGRNRVESAT